MKTLRLLTIIMAAAFLGSSPKSSAAVATIPEGCSSINFKLTIRCQDEKTGQKSSQDPKKALVSVSKITNSDILDILGDLDEADYLGAGAILALCNEGSGNFCNGQLWVLFPKDSKFTNFPVDAPFFEWTADCDCKVVTGKIIENHGCPVGKWLTEAPGGFTMETPGLEEWGPISANFCGLGKVTTTVKYNPADKHNPHATCTCTETFTLIGTGCWSEDEEPCFVTGSITGSGVNNCDLDFWLEFWNLL